MTDKTIGQIQIEAFAPEDWGSPSAALRAMRIRDREILDSIEGGASIRLDYATSPRDDMMDIYMLIVSRIPSKAYDRTPENYPRGTGEELLEDVVKDALDSGDELALRHGIEVGGETWVIDSAPLWDVEGNLTISSVDMRSKKTGETRTLTFEETD